MKNALKSFFAVMAVCAICASTATAQFIDINMAGWSTFGSYQLAPGGLNSGVSVNIGAGSTITSIEFQGLRFEAINGSWQNELVLSVNDDIGAGAFYDWRPGSVAGPGVFGPATDVFGGGTGTTFGGGTFSTATGNLWVTVYETFNDGGNAVQDATITDGILRISYTAVPEPTALLLSSVGLIGLVVGRRRRV